MRINHSLRDKGRNNFSSLDEIRWLIDGETYGIKDKTQWLGVFMRRISVKKFLLMFLLLFISLSKVMAGETECASPQETVLHFYRWYLNEIKGEKYPLTQNYNGDKTRINKWVSSSLLGELKEGQLHGEIDYDYFTHAQDFFESWLTHINAKVIKQTLSQSEVQLSLGEKDLLNEYKVELNHESCWKINSVQPVS